MFKDSTVKIPYDDIDLEIRNLVSCINDIDGIETIESCCGHNEKPCFIWCKAESIEALNSFLFNYFDGECLWKITLDVADVHASSKEIRFIISSGEYKDYPVVNLMIDNLTYRFNCSRTQTLPQITVFTETADEKAVAALKAELQNVLEEQRPQGKWTRTEQSKVLDEKPQDLPIFNREVLEQVLKYWYDHLEVGNEEQNGAVWCAINTIKYCIEHSSGDQKGGKEE